MSVLTLFGHLLSFLLGKSIEVELLGHSVNVYLKYIRNCPNFQPFYKIYHFTDSLEMHDSSSCSRYLSANTVTSFCYNLILVHVKWYLICFTLYFPDSQYIEYFFRYFQAVSISSFLKDLFRSFAHFQLCCQLFIVHLYMFF